MSRRSDLDAIRKVSERIEVALRRNRFKEGIIIAAVILFLVAGLVLVFVGVWKSAWQLLVPQGLIQLLVVYSISTLIKLRSDNLRLQIIPELLRLADSEDAKRLAVRFIEKLIEER